MKKQTTKGSHYLPKTYLKNFMLNDELIMYKKGEKFFNKGASEASRIVNIKGEDNLNAIAKQNNLYRLDGIPEIEPDFMEDFFRELIENKITPTIKQIEKMRLGDPIDENMKKDISLFMASMLLRMPGYKAEMEKIYYEGLKFMFKFGLSEKEKQAIQKDIKETDGKDVSEEDLEKAVDLFMKDQFKITLSSRHFAKHILSEIGRYANIFANMNMVILNSEGIDYFITSDNPVAYFVPKDKVDFYNAPRSMASKYTEIYFPITKNHLVFLTRLEAKEIMTPINKEGFDRIENTLSCFSRDFIFSPLRKNILDDFAKECIPYPFKASSTNNLLNSPHSARWYNSIPREIHPEQYAVSSFLHLKLLHRSGRYSYRQ